nr:integumentary mucin A.1 [Helicoverpa armigera]
MILYILLVLTSVYRTEQHLTYPINYCHLAVACIHDNQAVCAATEDGCSRKTFLDQCDMYEYNCDFGARYKVVCCGDITNKPDYQENEIETTTAGENSDTCEYKPPCDRPTSWLTTSDVKTTHFIERTKLDTKPTTYETTEKSRPSTFETAPPLTPIETATPLTTVETGPTVFSTTAVETLPTTEATSDYIFVPEKPKVDTTKTTTMTIEVRQPTIQSTTDSSSATTENSKITFTTTPQETSTWCFSRRFSLLRKIIAKIVNYCKLKLVFVKALS